MREAEKPLAKLAFEMISYIEESSRFIEQLNLPMDEIEAVLAEYVFDKTYVSDDDKATISPEFIFNFTSDKLEALFNEYMSRKNSSGRTTIRFTATQCVGRLTTVLSWTC